MQYPGYQGLGYVAREPEDCGLSGRLGSERRNTFMGVPFPSPPLLVLEGSCHINLTSGQVYQHAPLGSWTKQMELASSLRSEWSPLIGMSFKGHKRFYRTHLTSTSGWNGPCCRFHR